MKREKDFINHSNITSKTGDNITNVCKICGELINKINDRTVNTKVLCNKCRLLYEQEVNMNQCDVCYCGKLANFELSLDELYWLWLIDPDGVNLEATPININLKDHTINKLEKIRHNSFEDLKTRLLTVFS